MLVSVIVPAFNADRYLTECLVSVRAQQHSHCEIIVVDDGSTDHTNEIARSMEGRFCKVLRQSNQGQAAAINAGLDVAQGEYIQFLDADDVLHPQKIRVQLERLCSQPIVER